MKTFIQTIVLGVGAFSGAFLVSNALIGDNQDISPSPTPLVEIVETITPTPTPMPPIESQPSAPASTPNPTPSATPNPTPSPSPSVPDPIELKIQNQEKEIANLKAKIDAEEAEKQVEANKKAECEALAKRVSDLKIQAARNLFPDFVSEDGRILITDQDRRSQIDTEWERLLKDQNLPKNVSCNF